MRGRGVSITFSRFSAKTRLISRSAVTSTGNSNVARRCYLYGGDAPTPRSLFRHARRRLRGVPTSGSLFFHEVLRQNQWTSPRPLLGLRTQLCSFAACRSKEQRNKRERLQLASGLTVLGRFLIMGWRPRSGSSLLEEPISHLQQINRKTEERRLHQINQDAIIQPPLYLPTGASNLSRRSGCG